MSNLILTNHFSLASAAAVNDICQPLNNIGVSYFNYIKVYNDSSRELLTNNADWIDFFYRNKLYKTTGVINIEHLLPKGYFLWSELDSDDPVYQYGRDLYNIDNGISFVEKTKEYTILYIFASTKSNYTINNFYLRNIDLFRRFILYFNDEGNQLIRKAKNNKIILPEKQIIKDCANNNNILSNEERNAFIESTLIKKFMILNKGEQIQLSRREAETAAYMINGYTAKEIAKILGLSFRTVEKFNSKVKEKLAYKTKQELENILTENGLIEAIMSDTLIGS